MSPSRVGVAWWRSLYLRIGVSFVALVIAIALIQGLLFTAKMQRDARDPRRSPHAVAMEVAGEGAGRQLTFTTNLDHVVAAGPDHSIRVAIDPDTGEPSPYVLVRDGLEALIARPVFYDLVELAEERGTAGTRELGVWSGGRFFTLGRMEP